MKTEYVPKEKIFPDFARITIFSNLDEETLIEIRNDFPDCANDFLKEHELFHSRDKATFWLWREIKANAYASFFHPLGFFYVLFRSIFSYERLKYYFYTRFKQGR